MFGNVLRALGPSKTTSSPFKALFTCFKSSFTSDIVSPISSVPPVGYGLFHRFYCEPVNYTQSKILQEFHSDSAINDLQKYGLNYNWYYSNRKEIVDKHFGEWIVIDDKKILSSGKTFYDAVIPVDNLNGDSAFVVYCGLEKINAYLLNFLNISQSSNGSGEIENLALQWYHVAYPHEREWCPLAKNEKFNHVFRAVYVGDNDNPHKVRPYITLPITLCDGVSYITTFLMDTGADDFYLSRHFMRKLAELYDEKHKSMISYFISASCLGSDIILKDPQLHPATENVNVMPYWFIEKHNLMIEYFKWRRDTNYNVIEDGLKPYADDMHPYATAKARFESIMRKIIQTNT